MMGRGFACLLWSEVVGGCGHKDGEFEGRGLGNGTWNGGHIFG